MTDPQPKGTTMTDETEQPTAQERALQRLREPFEPHQISLLPKQVKRGDNDRFECVEGPNLRRASKDGRACGGYHAWSIHLDYVGHAALTDRLLEADPLWTWEPLALTEGGLPLFDREGGLWIRLTVAGMTRLGYGDAQGKTGPNATKEAIGDALRNAGMRFGAALDLWHKGDLHDASEQQGSVEAAPATRPARETAPAGSNQAAEIAPARQDPALVGQAINYAQTANGADSSAAVMAVFQKARRDGLLGMVIEVPGVEAPLTLREFLVGLGNQWKAREGASKAAGAPRAASVSQEGEIRADVLDPGAPDTLSGPAEHLFDDTPPWATGGYTESDLV